MKKGSKIQLDFSGGPGSWFNLWHTHVAWGLNGKKQSESRTVLLNKLVELYQQYKADLAKYPRDFQIWILIDDKDSGQDAVYIHTKSPNSDNFPIKVPGDKSVKSKNKELKKLLSDSKFEIIRYKSKEGDLYYLFERGTGINLD